MASFQWPSVGTSGVSSISITSANGFSGSVNNSGGANTISLFTTVTGVLKGAGSAIVAATAGTDYVIPSGSITGTARNVTGVTNATLVTLNALSLPVGQLTGTLAVLNGGTGVTTGTGTGNNVLSNSPTLVTPALDTPSALVGTNITGTAASLTAGNATTSAATTQVTNATLTTLSALATVSSALTLSAASTALTVTNNAQVSGILGLGGAPFSSIGLYLQCSGIGQAIQASPVLAAGAGAGVYLSAPSSAAAAAITNFTHYQANDIILGGGGSAITRYITLWSNTGHIGVNNAILSDNGSFLGNFFLNQSGTDPSLFGGAIATKNYQTATPVAAGTVTGTANLPGLLMTPAGTLASLTIKLPSTPIDGMQWWVATSQTITAATWQDAGGTAANVVGGPASLTTLGVRFVYSLANTKWYSIG